MKLHTKILSFVLGLCLCLPSLGACGSKPTDDRIDAETVVGTVDGKDVFYDELYFLVKNYSDSVKNASGEENTATKEALDKLVRENIVTNFAILKLCEQVELDYPKNELKRDVKKEVSSILSSSFGGDKESFEASLAEVGLTERYLRYSTEVDLQYGRLLTHYPEKGLVKDGEDEVRAYIKQNFVRTVHVMNPDYDQILEAYEKLNDGTLNMYRAIGSVYNKDFNSVSANGYYFSRGTMDEAYEAAAYALAPEEISPIVTSMGEIDGTFGRCYYIIQRLPLEDDYITDNLSSLQNEYYSGVIWSDMEKIRETLVFTPNELYEDLDLSALPVPHESSDVWWIVLAVSGGVLLVAVAIAVPVILIKKKHGKKNLAIRRDA